MIKLLAIMEENVPLKVGDWVKSYSSGIWQIYRILDCKRLNPATGDEQDKTTIFSKRFLSNAYKRSFKEECCDPHFVTRLNSDEKSDLNKFISENPKLYETFLAYEPKNIDCVYNARIGIPDSRDLAPIVEALKGTGVMRDIDISEYLNNLGYDTTAMPYRTIQFVSENHNMVDGYLYFKFKKVLGQ